MVEILILKRMLRHFQNISPIKKILEFQDWKKDYEGSTNYSKSEIKSMIENVKMSFMN